MAMKTMSVVRPGLYGTRMLKAGDALEVNGRDARLYAALGWATDKAPRRVQAKPSLDDKTKAELARMAGLTTIEAKKLTKAQIIAKLK